MNHDCLTPLRHVPFENINYEDQSTLFDIARAFSLRLHPDDGVPLQVFQYWNDTPDEQVARLLEQTRKHCEDAGIIWRLFDEQSAANFLEDNFGARYRAAFDKCAHQAQRSDFFRYCFLLQEGGMWLDADLALIASPRQLMSSGVPVFFQRTKRPHRQLTNWLMIAPPAHPIIDDMVASSLANIEDDAFFQAHIRQADIASISGLYVVRRAVARHIHRHLPQYDGDLPPAKIIDEEMHDTYIQQGDKTLGEPLHYKRTQRAWQRWRKSLLHTGYSSP